MIAYLRGTVFENVEGKVILDVNGVGSPGAVGYQVTIPQSQSYLSVRAGSMIELFIYSHVREDAFELYGFLTRAEKELFLTLLSVKGIGPKGAVGILSKVEPAELIRAVVNRDQDALTRIPGIGKKTAERVVVELADPLAKKLDAGAFQISGATAAGPAIPVMPRESSLMKDSRDALLGLGYRDSEITSLLKKVFEEGSIKKVEDVIRAALQKSTQGEIWKES